MFVQLKFRSCAYIVCSDVVDVWDSQADIIYTAQMIRAGTLFAAAVDPSVADSVIVMGGMTSDGSADPTQMFRISVTTATTSPSSTTATPTPSVTVTTISASTATSTGSTPPPPTLSPLNTITTAISSTSPSASTSSSQPTASPRIVPTTTPQPTVPGGCTSPPPYFSAYCANNVWIVNSSLTITTPQLNISSTPLVIQGSLNITSNDTVVLIDLQQPVPGLVPITVRDGASLGGTLQILLHNVSNTDITVLTASNISGTFHDVNVLSDTAT